LYINELKAAGKDLDRIKIGDRLTFETASTQDAGRRPAMCEWRDIRLVELRLISKAKWI
jgi:hypothetical protein